MPSLETAVSQYEKAHKGVRIAPLRRMLKVLGIKSIARSEIPAIQESCSDFESLNKLLRLTEKHNSKQNEDSK